MVEEKDKKLFQKIYLKERKGGYLKIEKDLELLLKKYSQVKDRNALLFRAELLLIKAMVFIYKGNYKETQKIAREAVKIFKRYHKFKRLAQALNRIAEGYRFSGNYKKAKEYTQKAITVLKKRYSDKKLKKILPPFLRELASAFIKLENYSKAEKVLRKAYRMTLENGDKFTQGHLALTFFTLYLQTQKLKEAEDYLKIGEAILKRKDKSITTQIIILIDWAKLYRIKNDPRWKPLVEEAIRKAKKYGLKYLEERAEKVKEE